MIAKPQNPGALSEPCQASKMKLFPKCKKHRLRCLTVFLNTPLISGDLFTFTKAMLVEKLLFFFKTIRRHNGTDF